MNHDIVFVNDYVAELLGYRQRALLGRSLFELMDKPATETKASQKINAHTTLKVKQLSMEIAFQKFFIGLC